MRAGQQKQNAAALVKKNSRLIEVWKIFFKEWKRQKNLNGTKTIVVVVVVVDVASCLTSYISILISFYRQLIRDNNNNNNNNNNVNDNDNDNDNDGVNDKDKDTDNDNDNDYDFDMILLMIIN